MTRNIRAECNNKIGLIWKFYSHSIEKMEHTCYRQRKYVRFYQQKQLRILLYLPKLVVGKDQHCCKSAQTQQTEAEFVRLDYEEMAAPEIDEFHSMLRQDHHVLRNGNFEETRNPETGSLSKFFQQDAFRQA